VLVLIALAQFHKVHTKYWGNVGPIKMHGALQDLNTLTPTISLSDGTIAKLIYEDSIGTCLILTEEASAEKPTQLKYLGKTEKLLFVRPEGNRVTPPRFTLQRY
jgi:hypothetical protein